MSNFAQQGYSRPAMDRLYRIHLLLQAKEYPNGTDLSREFEVSRRTVMRDIDFMKIRMDLPIEYDYERRGYYYSKDVGYFPQMPLSESEIFALLVAQKAVGQYRGTPFERPLEQAFRRLSGQLDRTVKYSLGHVGEALSFRPFAPGDADLKTFETLTVALRDRRAVRFQYRNRGETKRAARHVRPYHLACVQNQWYLLAFDIEKRDMRTFSLARIEKASATSARFAVPAGFNPNEYLAGSFGVFKGRDDYEVVMDFDAWAADEVRGRRWHSTQEITELPGGALRLRLRLNNIEEVEKWVLGMGTHATVIRPRALADRIQRITEALSRRYSQLSTREPGAGK